MQDSTIHDIAKTITTLGILGFLVFLAFFAVYRFIAWYFHIRIMWG